MNAARSVERWDTFELEIGSAGTSQAVGSQPTVTFEHGGRVFEVEAFVRDGGLVVRFMPDEVGTWTYTVRARPGQPEPASGTFTATPASPGNHGPVRAQDGTRFAYADGHPFVPVGTAALWWHEQDDRRRSVTLAALAEAGFTKVRMSALPAGPDDWPDAKSLDRLERAVADLRALGVEAELVLFDAGEGGLRSRGPGPGWREYVREVIARVAAYRNVSWCVAMDVDRIEEPAEGWAEVLSVVTEYDSGRHLRTIHGGTRVDFGLPTVTHASLRADQVRVVSRLTDAHRKPVVVDSCGFEGDAPGSETSLPGEDLVARMWEATCRGGFASHGEWFVGDGDEPWWSLGGRLAGASAARISFLRSVLEGAPAGLSYSPVDHDASTLELPGRFYLQYYGPHRFRTRRFALPPGEYRIACLDTWNMTVRELPGTYAGEFSVDLPGALYQALRIEAC